MNYIKLSLLFILFSSNLFAQDGDTLLLATENIYFDFGKDEIRNNEMDKLNQLAEKIQGDVRGFIQLTGHTDSIGNDSNNNDLSERRANEVIQYLVGKGIAPKLRFYTGYKGEYTPVADNGSEEGRQKNRRVEIQVFQENGNRIVEKTKAVREKKGTSHKVEFVIKGEGADTLVQSKVLYKQDISDDYKTAYTDANGVAELDLELEEENKIFFEFYAKGYFHNSEEMVLKRGEKFLFAVKLKPIKKGNKLRLKNFYFYSNQAKLLPKSTPELRRLKNSLEMNPNVIVEIGGHINFPNVHPNAAGWRSQILSENRAKFVHNYLVNNGIDAKRLSHKGYSSTQMVNPKASTEADMEANRRVEIKVIGNIE